MGKKTHQPVVLRSAVGKTHVLRLRLVMNSEIDHLHLSSEAQCDSTLLPLGDCHRWARKKMNSLPEPPPRSLMVRPLGYAAAILSILYGYYFHKSKM